MSGFILPALTELRATGAASGTGGDCHHWGCLRVPWARGAQPEDAAGAGGAGSAPGRAQASLPSPGHLVWSLPEVERASVTGQGLWVAPPALGWETVSTLPLTPPNGLLPGMWNVCPPCRRQLRA